VSYETMIWERDGAVGRITLNRPDSLNAWNNQFGEDLGAIVSGEAADEDVRTVLITGAGRGFSSGADLKAAGEAEPHPEDGLPDIGKRLRELFHPIITGIRTLEKPVIAAVNGPAVGIGCSLALACDLILAAESAYFQLAFVRVGLMPDGGSTAILPARIGKARAMEMALLAERVPAERALDWGLINAVHPDDQLMDVAGALAERLAAGPTRAYAAGKLALNHSLYPNLTEQLDLEAQGQHELFRTKDVIEGGLAFLEKRDPEFTGN
jgi:2-(1,2-epoxy-1,2-dihydrophenyl)acetyl-CoA isomerase